MTVVLLVGAGAVGRRAARQLAETDGVERLLIADRAPGVADEAAEAMGARAEAVDWAPDRAGTHHQSGLQGFTGSPGRKVVAIRPSSAEPRPGLAAEGPNR